MRWFLFLLLLAGCVTQEDVRLHPGMRWYWQLTGDVNTSVPADVYDVDLSVDPSVIDEVHRRGALVVCYFSAGTAEKFRDDYSQFPPSVLGKPMKDWSDEKWLDIREYERFAPVIVSRLDTARNKGCDGVEADNVDGYLHDTGFDLTYEDQLRYNRWLAEVAHRRGLLIGLKNDIEQVPDLIDVYDFAVNEQCFEYDECEALLPFIERGKPVFGVEYNLPREVFCERAKGMNLSWAWACPDLNGCFEPC